MNEFNQDPKSTAAQETTLPEILEKFSKGEIQLGEGAVIKGEGKERKITITLTSDDPFYLRYASGLESFTELARNVSRLAGNNEPGLENIATALNQRKQAKQTLSLNVLCREVEAFTKTSTDDFLKRFNGIPEGESKEELLLEIGNFDDLVGYITHLTLRNAFEVILPEQQIRQGRRQK